MQDSQFSFQFLEGLLASGLGSFVGTVVKIMRNPPESIVSAAMMAFTSIFIGTLVGGACYEYFNLGPWVTSSAAACGAYVSEEVIRAVEGHSKKLRDLELPKDKNDGA